MAVKKSMMTCVDVMLNEDPDLSVVDMQGKINEFLIITFPLHLDSFKVK